MKPAMEVMTDGGRPSFDTGRRGVALLGFSTQSSYGPRVDWTLLGVARALRRAGTPSVLFQIHFHGTDDAENARRTDELVLRVQSGGYKWVLCAEMWTVELGRRLLDAGIQILESRRHSLPGAVCDPSLDTIFADPSSGGPPLDEYQGLVELIGLPSTDSVANVDLTIGDACSYQTPIADNPFFADIASDPRFSGHRGCAYCFNATHLEEQRAPSADAPRDKTDRLLDEMRARRATLPGLKTVWMPFAEMFYENLAEAFDRSVGDPVWRGLTMSMQCRPDVITDRRRDIEQLGRKAHLANTSIKIAVVGYENFAPAELQRLNRGVTPEHLASAAAIMDGWRREPIPGLDVRGYVPSFILFTPWTTLEDLELNLREIELNGLSSANIERMRLGSSTPLHEMARRAHLTGGGPVRLAVHPNGYFSETGYRFRDPRVAAACDGFDMLKPLAHADQAPLLAAVVDAVQRSEDPSALDWKAVATSWRKIGERALSTAANAVARPSLPGVDVRRVIELLATQGYSTNPDLSQPARGRTRAHREMRGAADERVVLGVGRDCNNGCQPCVWNRRLEFAHTADLPLAAPVEGRNVYLGGREPTVNQDLPALVRALREAGAARIDIDTNGRRLLYRGYALALEASGVDTITVKLFGIDASTWDAHTRVPGSFAQSIEAMAIVSHFAPRIVLNALVFPGREFGVELNQVFAFARSIGLARLRVVLRLARQDLLALDTLGATIESLLASPDGPTIQLTIE